MARGGQLGLSPPPTPWWKYVLYALGALLVIWVVVKALTPCPPPVLKEKMSNCGCSKKNDSKPWIPFS